MVDLMSEKKLDIPGNNKKAQKKSRVRSSKTIQPETPELKAQQKSISKSVKPPKAKKIKVSADLPVESTAKDSVIKITVDDAEQSLGQLLFDSLVQRWAYLELRVLSPKLPVFDPTKMILPDLLIDNSGFEFVYPILDQGFALSTSKGEDFVATGMSMYKLYVTIEKMICILTERLRSEGIDDTTQVDIAFAGNEMAMRKAFESIIHLKSNLVIVNYDPGTWGDGYLQRVKNLIERGLGGPAEAPRDFYRKSYAEVLKSVSKTK